jgi:hypothetical protein
MSPSADKRRTGPGQEGCVWPTPVIQTPKLGARIMRYELADYEWVAIKPMLPKQAAWRPSGERPTCPEWHFLGLAIRSTLA